jgi:hypothetical protein
VIVSPKTSKTVGLDMMMLLMLGFVCMIVFLLPHVNPPKENDKAEPPGNVIVAITWPEGDIDIDMWITGPGEKAPVGYSNKSGVLFNLLRDDLGRSYDPNPLNFEHAYSRGIVAGEYIVNLHAYRGVSAPIKIHVEISLNTGKPGKGMTPVATTSVMLTANGQEKTALRFRLDKDGKLVPGSMNNVFRQLRSAQPSGM